MKSRSVSALREGFTTGTAAAAAAAAAVGLLCGKDLPGALDVALPPFAAGAGGLEPENPARLRVPLSDGGLEGPDLAWAGVVKDGGDDPDATHGALIIARAARKAFAPARAATPPVEGPAASAGKGTGELPDIPAARVFLYAGKGVGTVTLPGLPVAAGEAAINPEPRKQIAFAALEAAAACGLSGPLHIEISAPDGEERARRTLNPRLGIVGGISILGTRGIVRPYSHEAWKCAVSQGLDVAAALGLKEILLCTGRRSERLGLALLPHLPRQAAVQAADYAAHAVRAAAGHSFSRLNWVCFPGKLLKLAQGLEWTHARSAGADLSLLARLYAEQGGDARIFAGVPTAAGVFALLAKTPALHDALLEALAAKALAVLRSWLAAAGGAACEPALHVFSLEGRHLLTLP